MIETEERSLQGVALSRLATVGRMTASGANPPLLWLAANVTDCSACIFSTQDTRRHRSLAALG
jgi:hypothetical protein